MPSKGLGIDTTERVTGGQASAPSQSGSSQSGSRNNLGVRTETSNTNDIEIPERLTQYGSQQQQSTVQQQETQETKQPTPISETTAPGNRQQEKTRTNQSAMASQASSIAEDSLQSLAIPAEMAKAKEMNASISHDAIPPSMSDGMPGNNPSSTNELNDNGFVITPMSTQGQALTIDNNVTSETEDNEASDEEAYIARYGNIPMTDDLLVSDPEQHVTPLIMDAPSQTFKKVADDIVESEKETLGESYAYGNNLGGYVISNETIGLREIGIGDKILLAAIEQPTSRLRQKLSDALLESDPESQFTQDILLEIAQNREPGSIAELIVAINNAKIQVFTKKDPTVGDGDQHIRTMKIVYGDGMYLHPLSAKIYNADHDGDKMVASLEALYGRYMPDAMDKIVTSSGKAMIDEDFFLLHPWTQEQMLNGVEEILRSYGITNKKDIKDITKSLQRILNMENESFGNFLKLVKKASYKSDTGQFHLDVFAGIVEDIYTWNNEQWICFMADDMESLPNSYTPQEKRELFSEPGDYLLAQWFDMASEATDLKMFFNHQEAKNFFAKSLGLIPGKNLEFRIGAGFAKLIKLDDSMIVGDHVTITDNNFDHFILKSIDYQYSLIMSNRIYVGDKQIFAKEWVRRHFIDTDSSKRKQIVPSRYLAVDQNGNVVYDEEGNTSIDWRAFQRQFYERYNIFAPMVDGADVKVRTDGSIEKKSSTYVGGTDRATYSASDFVRKFKRIYGDIKLGALLGRDSTLVRGSYTRSGDRYSTDIGWSLAGYENMTVNEFIRTKHGQIAKPKNWDITDRIENSHQFIYALSDLSRKEASEFNSQLVKGAKNAVVRLKEMNEILEVWNDENRRNYSSFLDCVTEALCLFDQDTFAHFGMDSPQNWINSKWGQKILSIDFSNTDRAADSLLNILNQMTIEARLSKPRTLLSSYKSAVDTKAQVKQSAEALRSRYESAMQTLASSSPFYGMLVGDLNARGAVFKDTRERIENNRKDNPDKKPYLWGPLGNRDRSMKLLDGDWKLIEQHDINSFMELIRSDEITWSQKEKIISDVLKLNGNANYMSNEINHMIRQDADTIHAGNRFTDLDGYSQTMEDIKAASDTLDRNARKTWDSIVDEVNSGLDLYGETGVEALLDSIKADPMSLVEIDTALYVDAINSALDKEHADSEKAQQQDCINAIVTAISFARSGGLFSDLAIVDDLMTGRIAEDRFKSNMLIQAYLLANPEVQLTVYNEKGFKIVSRDSLCGKDGQAATMTDVVDFLRSNPRVAMSLRKHKASAGEDGNSYLLASEDFSQCLDRVVNKEQNWKQAYHHLIDHPGFGALVIATTPTSRTTSRRKRSETRGKIQSLTEDLLKLSNRSNEEIKSIIDNIDFGGAPKDALSDEFGLGYDSIEEEYEAKVKRMKLHILRYAIELRKLPISKAQEYSADPNPKFNYFDLSDINTYSAVEDIEQMLSGGKTQVLTGVNGAETTRNGVFAYYASIKTNPCETDAISVPSQEIRDNFDRYEGWHVKTEDGRDLMVLQEYLDEILRGNDSVLLYDPATCSDPHCPCKNHAVADGSTSNVSSAQMTAMSLMAVIQRMDSTEKNLLKWKKIGISDSELHKLEDFSTADSITKFSAIDILRGWEALSAFNRNSNGSIQEAYTNGGITEARREYARIMRDNQRNLGYDDLSLSQYENIAHMLLFEVNGHVEALSASQLAYIANRGTNLRDLYACESVPELQQLMLEAVDNYSFDGDLDIIDTLSNVKVKKKSDAVMTVRRKSSSMERNLVTAYQIWHDARDIKPMSKERIKSEATSIARNHTDLVYQFPYAFDIRERTRFGKTRKEIGNYGGDHYNLIGIVSGTENKQNIHIPSRLNLWIIDSSADMQSIAQALVRAQKYGITVAMNEDTYKYIRSEDTPIDRQHLANIVEAQGRNGQPTYMIPFFDMKQNGTDFARGSYDPEQSFNVGVYQYHPSNITRLVEDPFNEHKLGDAQGAATSDYLGRTQANKTGTWKMPIERMFADVLSDMDGSYLDAHVMSNAEEAALANTDAFENIEDQIAFGVVNNGSNRFNSVRRDMKFAWWKYKDNFARSKSTDNYSYKRCKPGDIVGWVKLTYQSKSEHALVEKYAPIRPYQLDEKKGCPSTFDINFRINELTGEVVGDWSHKDSLKDHLFKFFEGNNPFNKLMIDGQTEVGQRLLRSGNPLDVYVAKPSTASRRMSNVRMDSMYTLMMEARQEPHGYNLAEHDWALPNRPDIKAALLNGTATYADWKTWTTQSKIEFIASPDPTADPEAARLNSFLNMQAKKALSIGVNPSFWFASRFGDNRIPHYIGFHYNAMMSSDPKYQEDLQLWLNKMDSSLCPKFGGDYTNTLFRNSPDDGSLQMQVPIHTKDGREFWWWCNVYTSFSFMDQHYSGGEKPSISGKRFSYPGLLTLGYGGKFTDKDQLKHIIRASAADRSSELANNMSMGLDPEDKDMV